MVVLGSLAMIARCCIAVLVLVAAAAAAAVEEVEAVLRQAVIGAAPDGRFPCCA